MSTNPTDFRVKQYAVPGAAIDPQIAAHLFRPLTVRKVTFANRIFVLPAMVTCSAQDGFATDEHLVHVGQFALRGVGLAIVEAAAVAPDGRISSGCLGLWNDEQIAPLKRIADFYHTHHGKIGIQVSHAGLKAWVDPETRVAPSTQSNPMVMPTEMTVEQIQATVTAFASAVHRAFKADFDVVEIDAARGSLIHQFLSPVTNHRTDEYGGSLDNRMRFLLEVVDAVSYFWLADNPMFLHLSCTDWVEDSSWGIDEAIEVVRRAAVPDVDVIVCSADGDGGQDQTIQAHVLPFAEKLKHAVPEVLAVTVGGRTVPADVDAIIADGRADAVLLSREILQDSWVARAAKTLDTEIGLADQCME
ncbi:hypothetical protein AMAG_13791 [Allomyces macrogynus ATCC 38327]|uniref:NADH:flavin oxidoreductase/NADH oxidase N-terminal domain-containing protein n=1 Tax=Allomyces macrogynus (strain ATCC 38327) TaxID=578462 RepID=A0A0L0T3Y2_ALLM3|nr:hypothetical protein AMAG_13791 [Allomyces macrogynus ATCC 38327]|eukprot:KNE69431.1 hypothetical protein AMAG_13791 [Allomyces macrogynus ATCC 38327]